MRKIKLQKIVGNLLDMLRKLYVNETVIQKFVAFLKLQKILGNFCFSEQIFYRKQSLGAPDNYSCEPSDRLDGVDLNECKVSPVVKKRVWTKKNHQKALNFWHNGYHDSKENIAIILIYNFIVAIWKSLQGKNSLLQLVGFFFQERPNLTQLHLRSQIIRLFCKTSLTTIRRF